MEEGSKTKKTVFVGNIADDVDESVLLETFSTFGGFSPSHMLLKTSDEPSPGDVMEVQIPPATTDPNRQTGQFSPIHCFAAPHLNCITTEEKHKGYGFVTFSSSADAQDAIDNMDLNELRGKVIRVNLARPTRIPEQGMGNRASRPLSYPRLLSH